MSVRTLMVVAFLVAAGCGHDTADDELYPVRAPATPRVVSAQEALSGAEIPKLDPATMNDAEISRVLGEGPFCAFRYVSDGTPVLAWKRPSDAVTNAVVKLNGRLLVLEGQQQNNGTFQFAADEVRLTFMPGEPARSEQSESERPRPAKLVFEIDQKLRVGYGGYAVCSPGWLSPP